jgi:hypothetical protein
LIADDGPCSYPVDGYDIMGGIQEAFWERFRHEVLTVGGHNSIELWYSKAIQALSGQKDSETFWNGFMLDFSVTVDISPDPLGSPTVCSTSVHAYTLNGGVQDSSPSAVEELVGGVLTLTGGVASSNADGGLGEDELEATITEALNKQLAPGVTGSLLSGESMRQTSDPFNGKNPLKPGAGPLTCEVGSFGACTLEAGVLSEGVRRAIKYVFREPSMHPYLPAWYWDDLPNFGSADDEAEFWERYQKQLQEAIFQNLSPAAQTHPNEFGDGELQSRTSFRNWRCIHDASRDKPGLGRCEVVPRAVRLSRKPGGIHLVWFDNPWADHQNPDGSLSDAAFNIALWVAAHAPAEDGPVVEPDDIVKGPEALCAATKPQWASMSHSPPYSKGYHYWKP